MKYLYKYPQAEYPYKRLLAESLNRNREVPEFELLDTDVFDENRYWDIVIEYANQRRTPQWTTAPPSTWDYTRFGKPPSQPAPAEKIAAADPITDDPT